MYLYFGLGYFKILACKGSYFFSKLKIFAHLQLFYIVF